MDRRAAWDGLALVALFLIVASCAVILLTVSGTWALRHASVATPEIPASYLLFGGVAMGVVGACALARIGQLGGVFFDTLLPWAACAGAVASLVARLDGIPFARAFPTILLGFAGLAATFQALRSIDRGDALGAENHWGGLGNGLGGWRLTPATSAALLGLLLCFASIACGFAIPPSSATASVAPPPAHDGGAGSQPASTGK